MQSNFHDDLLAEAGDEPIRFAVIGEYGWGYDEEDAPQVPAEKRSVLLPWSEAAALLNYPYNTGYGAPKCHAVYAWTDTRVLYVVQYDGSTSVHSLPRNPADVKPEMPGS